MNHKGWMLSPGKTLHPVYILDDSSHHDFRPRNYLPSLSRYPTPLPAPSPYETYPPTPQIYENSMNGMSHQNGVPSQLVSPISDYQHSYSTPVSPYQIPQRVTWVHSTPQYIVQPSLAHVSIGSAGTMADSCGIAELKETIEKVNSELDQLRTKISELNAKVREQEECLSTSQTEMSNLREENAQAQTEMNNLREENAQLASSLKEVQGRAGDRIQKLEQQLTEKETELIRVQGRAGDRIQKLEQQLTEKETELIRVQDCQGRAGDRIQKLEQQLTEKETELIRVQDCQGRAGDRIQKLEQQLTEKETELIRVQDCQGRAGDRIQKLEQQLTEKETELIRVQECQGRAGDRIQKLEQQLTEKETELIRVQDCQGRAGDRIQKLEQQLREKETKLIRSEEKCWVVQERLDLAEKKLAQFSEKPVTDAEECLAQISFPLVEKDGNSGGVKYDSNIKHLLKRKKPDEETKENNVKTIKLTSILKGSSRVNETNDDALDINSLHNEIILKIFSYLTQNQLGQIARVCRRWNVLAKSPVLWRKVNVKIFSSDAEKNTVTKSFVNGLPSCVTFIRLEFPEFVSLDFSELDFEKLCAKLHQNCPHVEELILERCVISNILPEVINFCTQFLQCVKKLVFHNCSFYDSSRRVELSENSKIEVLDLYGCAFFQSNKTQFSKLLYLRELRLSHTDVYDTWFEDDTSFFNQLHVLDLGWTSIALSTFLAIQRHGHNLKELYLCKCSLWYHDLNFNNSIFRHLKTICLCCKYVRCEAVVSLIQSCPSLENVYVTERMARTFAAHPFVVANRCKSGIVKSIVWRHNHKVDYSHI